MSFVFVKKIGGGNGTKFKVSLDPTDTICDLSVKVFTNETRQKYPWKYGFNPVNFYEEDTIDSKPLNYKTPLFENGRLSWNKLFFSEQLELTSNLSPKQGYEFFVESLKGDGWKIHDKVVYDFHNIGSKQQLYDLRALFDYREDTSVGDFIFPEIVTGEGETSVQEALNPVFTGLGALVANVRPVYHAKQPDGDDGTFQTTTGKPNYTAAGNGRAVTVELKTESTLDACYEVVLRCLERVTGFLQANHLLRKAVSIGVTPERAFLVVATVDDSNKVNQVRIRIHQIDPSNVLRFYCFFANQEDAAEHFSVHARAILEAITHVLGEEYRLLFHYFGIKLLSKSSSFVYRVTIPEWEKDFDFALHDHCNGFVVKVNEDETRFEKEVNIFKRLAGTEQGYAVAAGWVLESKTKHFVDSIEHIIGHESWVADLRESAQALQKGIKLELPMFPSSSFGFIVMRQGVAVSKEVMLSAWERNLQVVREDSEVGLSSNLNLTTTALEGVGHTLEDGEYEAFDRVIYVKMAGVAKSLLIMHERNVCHGDIRRENVLYFEHLHRFALIDYDLAVDLGEPESGGKSTENDDYNFPPVEDAFVYMNEISNRFHYCKPLQSAMGFTYSYTSHASNPLKVKWSKAHDWMMFAMYGVERTLHPV